MLGGYNPWFCQELQRRVRQAGAEKMSQMASGMCPDYAAYRQTVGEIAGLELALDIADEIRKEQDSA